MASPAYCARVQELARRRAAGATPAQLARDTGWQPGSVMTAICNLRRGRLRPPTRFWTEEMDALLERHWEIRNSTQIARILNKVCPGRHVSFWAVNARARRKGLVKPGVRSDWWSEKMAVIP